MYVYSVLNKTQVQNLIIDELMDLATAIHINKNLFNSEVITECNRQLFRHGLA